MMTQPTSDEPYVSTDQREMSAYYDAMSRMHVEESIEGYDEDMDILRSTM